MKLQNLYEVTTVDAMKKAGIYVSQQEFREKFDLIIDFQKRMNDLYDDLEDKLGIIRFEKVDDYPDPQVASSIDMEPAEGAFRGTKTTAWLYLNPKDPDFVLQKKNANAYIIKAVERFLPEVSITLAEAGNEYFAYYLDWKPNTMLTDINVHFHAPSEFDDNNFSNKARKRLKWW